QEMCRNIHFAGSRQPRSPGLDPLAVKVAPGRIESRNRGPVQDNYARVDGYVLGRRILVLAPVSERQVNAVLVKIYRLRPDAKSPGKAFVHPLHSTGGLERKINCSWYVPDKEACGDDHHRTDCSHSFCTVGMTKRWRDLL